MNEHMQEIEAIDAYDPKTAFGTSWRKMEYLEVGDRIVAYRWTTTTNRQLRTGRHAKMNIRTTIKVFGFVVKSRHKNARGKDCILVEPVIPTGERPEVERLLRAKWHAGAGIDYVF